ncbi:hypothetical protein [Mesorhizobium sp.]|nr:hypothetical protein [Mesorhizobium sp.]
MFGNWLSLADIYLVTLAAWHPQVERCRAPGRTSTACGTGCGSIR